MATITLFNVREHALAGVLVAVRRQVSAAGASCVVSGGSQRLEVRIEGDGGLASAVADGIADWYDGWRLRTGPRQCCGI